MYKGQRQFVLAACTALLAACIVQAADDPCSRKYAGAWLIGNLVDLSLTADSLKLLDGHEAPKLKRLLEWHLVTAAAAARQHVDEGAALENAPALPNLAEGVERATVYVAEHDLDGVPPLPAVKSSAKPSEDLAVVRKWLAKQP